MQFCDCCDNLLVKRPHPELRRYVNYCQTPGCTRKYFDPSPDDIVLFSRKKKTTDLDIMTYVNAAMYDDTYPEIKKKCEKCKNDTMRYFINEKTYKKVYVCRECQSYWY